jgi:Clostripain family
MTPVMNNEGALDGPKWTVMVFMGAATFEGNAPLIDAAEADLAEMRSVGSGEAFSDGGKRLGELNIFVQVNGIGWPRRGRITENMPVGISALEPVPEGEDDPAQGNAVESFIRWALSAAQHDPRRNHYSMLVLWGHAYDFAIGREHTKRGTIDAFDFAELKGVLERLQARYGAGTKLDILGFDACDLSSVEMAYQLQPFANYLLGSQIGIPIPGWPYDRILDRLRWPFGSLMKPVEFGSYVVRRFCEAYGAELDTVSLTLLDLYRAPDLLVHGEMLALMLASAIGDPDARDLICSLFLESQTAQGKPYVDVADLCLNLVRNSGDATIVAAAQALGDFLISPVPPVVGSRSGRRPEVGQGPLIVEHGRNAGETARLNGISLYAPHVAPNLDFDAVRHLYDNFDFAQRTHWSALVHELARTS